MPLAFALAAAAPDGAADGSPGPTYVAAPAGPPRGLELPAAAADRAAVTTSADGEDVIVAHGRLKSAPWVLACWVARADVVWGGRRVIVLLALAVAAASLGLTLALVGLRQRRLAQERSLAAASATRLAAALDQGGDVSLFLGDDGVVTEARGGVSRVYGVDASALVGRSITSLLADPSGAARAPELPATGVRVEETVHRRPDGREVPVELSFQRVVGGGVGATVMVRVRDVGERRRAEDRLRASEVAYRQLFDANPSPTWVFDVESHRILRVNAAAVRTYGWTSDEFQRMTVFDLRPAEDHARLRAHLREPRAESEGEWRHLRKDGTVFPVRVRGSAIDFLGRPARIVIVEDLTERRRAEAATRMLVRALEQAPLSIVVTDPDGGIEYVNPHFTQSTGYTSEEVIGKNPRILKSNRTPPEIYADLWRTIVAGRTWRGELVNRRKDGSEFAELASIAPVVDAKGVVTHYVAVKEDLTDRRAMEERATAAEARYLQAQKLEAVGQLAGGVAHDFNNLLCIILGYGQLVASALGREHPEAGKLEQVIAAGRRAEALTRQLLAYSRRQVLQPRIVDLHDLVAGFEKMLRRLIGEDIQLRTRLDAPSAIVLVDPGQLEQVLLNLVVNARDALPEGGNVTIRTRAEEVLEPRDVRGDVLEPGAWIVLSVEDDGVGMDAGTAARLFEPFFTTKPVGKGTGLGLPTVQGIVRQSGGHVDVRSRPGEGTTFEIFLPRCVGVPEVEVLAAADLQAYRGHETVLVVEDQEGVRELVRVWLEDLGYAVILATDGADALETANRLGRQVDLLLTDVVMPRIGGKELADRMAARWPRLQVIYMSGYTSDVIAQHGILAAGVRLLEKPLAHAALARAVREALDARG